MTQKQKKSGSIGIHQTVLHSNALLLIPIFLSTPYVSTFVTTGIFSVIILSLFVFKNESVLGNNNLYQNKYISILFDTNTDKIVFQSPAIERVLGFRPNSLNELILSSIFSNDQKSRLCSLFNTEKTQKITLSAKDIQQNDIYVNIKKVFHKKKSMVIIDFVYNKELKEMELGHLKKDEIQTFRRVINYPQTKHTVLSIEPKSNGSVYEEGLLDVMLKNTPQHLDHLNIQKIEMADVVKDACNSLKKLIDINNTEICFEHLPSVYADAAQLTHVIKNLIKNSIQYRSNLSPKICIDFRINDDELIFCVKDNGKGISNEYQTNVFTPYYRLNHIGRMIPGLGLGLTICKYIVNNHNGSMWCENNDSQGSRFYFSLPTPQANPLARMSKSQAQSYIGRAV